MRQFSGRAIAWCTLLLLVTASIASADQGVVSIEKLGGQYSGTAVTAGADVRFLIRFQNSTGEKCDISNGYKLSSPDGAVWDSTRIKGLGSIVGGKPSWFAPFFNVVFAFQKASADGHGEDTVSCLAAGDPTDPTLQMPSTWDDSVYAITAYFDGNKASSGKHICIDTAFFQPGGTWSWVGQSLATYYPVFQGLTPAQPYSDGNPGTRLGSGYCFLIYAPQLGLNPPQLNFVCQAAGLPPANQTFQVTSTGDSLGDPQTFSLIENSPWILKSPTGGTTPKQITVSINQTGLAPGSYLDSIQVQSATAVNSPQWERISLTVTSPPPTIALNKTSISFVGVTGGSNPASQTFVITNSGGSSLNWSLGHTSTWLGLNPTSGVDSATVTVSANITGLLAGTYSDTIIISDPLATNSPQKVAVTLTLGSNLPFIAVDSAVNHVIVKIGTGMPAPRTIYIRNGGVGTLTFTLSENSVRLWSESPMSGTAPESVAVSFKLAGYPDGTQLYDTLWVNSPEATNSPYPVVFSFLFVTNPAVIQPTKDTITFTTYECSSGLGGALLEDSIQVYNTGGNDPLDVSVIAHSTLAQISPLSGEAPFQINFQAANINPPLGTYYDTVLLTAVNAINSPRPVIIKYNRLAGSHQPQIVMAKDSFTISRQEQTGNVSISSTINNFYPGCMPWTITNSIPWFTPSKTSGNVPSVVNGLIDVDGLTRGTYRDTFEVVAPTASNSPKLIPITLKIWRLHGDVNWDGRIDVLDLTRLTSYLTTGNNPPLPEYIVGDMNCSGVVDLADLTAMVAYLLGNLPNICGNP